jgi:hypothetical protein
MLDLAEKIEGWQKWKCSRRQMSAIKAQVRVNHSGNSGRSVRISRTINAGAYESLDNKEVGVQHVKRFCATTAVNTKHRKEGGDTTGVCSGNKRRWWTK